jgi:heparin binding hemagglutinin HbhA
MTLASNIDKTRKDIEKAVGDRLGDKSPMLVIAGVTDLAAAQVRAARDEISSRAEGFDAKALRDEARARLAALPTIAYALPGKAQGAAEDAATMVVSSALIAYGDLSERGKTLVDRVRGQQSTQDLSDQASTTVAKAKATTTAAKKSAKTSASSTKTAAKSTTTSAKKTATAAKKAAGDAADKVGD